MSGPVRLRPVREEDLEPMARFSLEPKASVSSSGPASPIPEPAGGDGRKTASSATTPQSWPMYSLLRDDARPS